MLLFDTETRSSANVSEIGAHRYARAPDTICNVLTWTTGPDVHSLGPVETIATGPDVPIRWNDLPEAVRTEIVEGRAWAWNADFDEQIVIHALGAPIEPGTIRDAAGFARANRLPGALADAARAVGSIKLASGKRLIQLFATAEGPTDLGDPNLAAAWAEYLEYARQDVRAMVDILAGLRSPIATELDDARVAAIVNDRGLLIDVPAAATAAELAAEYTEIAKQRLVEITGDSAMSPGAHVRFLRWLLDLVGDHEDVRAALAKHWHENEAGEREIVKYSVDREHSARAIEVLREIDTPEVRRALDALEIRIHASGTSAKKFARLRDMPDPDDYRLRGAYVWNGADTGRYSSRGVQMHNLSRSHLGEAEARALDLLRRGCTLDDLADLSPNGDAMDALGRLVRPMIRAPVGHQLVWGDWSAIEARVLPWLAEGFEGAADTVATFAATDRDPSLPDVYVRAASDVLGLPISEIDKSRRQIGKVVVLALGFFGGVGALDAMASGYGVQLDDELKPLIVEKFRAANPWIEQFAVSLQEALVEAARAGEGVWTVGRITVVGLPAPGGADVYLILPDGRPLRYPAVRYGTYVKEDKETGEPIEQEGWLFTGRNGRVPIWPGLLSENVTQAVAGSLLRDTLRRLVLQPRATSLTVVGHTHDEIICEAKAADAAEAQAELLAEMQAVPDWAEGLPLAAETTTHAYYTKTK